MYGKEDSGADTAVWLAGGKEKVDQRLPDIGPSSIAHETIEALREIGLLDNVMESEYGLLIYPNAELGLSVTGT